MKLLTMEVSLPRGAFAVFMKLDFFFFNLCYPEKNNDFFPLKDKTKRGDIYPYMEPSHSTLRPSFCHLRTPPTPQATEGVCKPELCSEFASCRAQAWSLSGDNVGRRGWHLVGACHYLTRVRAHRPTRLEAL